MSVSHHFSSAKPFNWLRKHVFKIEKPLSLGWGEWSKWDAELKRTRPIANFFTETLPDWLEWIPQHSTDYFHDARWFMQNIFDGSTVLRSKLKLGQYHEFDQRLLHCAFDAFVDHIEGEVAWSHIAWSDKEEVKKYNIPFYVRYRWLNWFGKFKCPQAAIDHLKWEMNLSEADPQNPYASSDNHQAIRAREKMALYTWWKTIRPSRGDEWEETGFREFWDKMSEKYDEDDNNRTSWLGLGSKSKMTAAEKRTYKKLSNAKDELEQQREDEDNEMLIRLVNLRKALWT